MRVFSAGAAMISIVHAANESQMKNIAVSKSEEELEEALTRQYPNANSFEIQSFEQKSTDKLSTYEYVVKYNATSMWAYAVTYGILTEDQAYVVTGTVTDDNKTLLAAVVKSVESFTVLSNDAFSLTLESESETTQLESQQQSEAASASEELQSLTDYGTSTTLYASDNVYIRKEPSTEADILGGLNTGDAVTVVGETSQWFKVNISGTIAYISKAFLVSTPTTSETSSTDDSQTSETSASAQTVTSNELGAEYNSKIDYGSSSTFYATAEVNLRSEPGTDADVIGSVPGGDSVTVIGETDNWYVVSVNGTTAYVSKAYVSSQNPGTTTTSPYDGTNGTDDPSEVIDAGSSTEGSSNTGSNSNETTAGGTDTSNDGSNSAGSVTSISGTIASAGVDTIILQGDDGNTYTINTGDAAVNTEDGIYAGLYVTATVGSSDSADGTLYASSVTGY
jgi:uncharacterized protein YgiM (DUF1202 family)